MRFIILWLLFLGYNSLSAQPYRMVWETPSESSHGSMPCGGGDIGLNVWVEQGDILFYLSRSGTFDENNCFLKLGRVRLTLSPNPLQGKSFRQELRPEEGRVVITAGEGREKVTVQLWTEIFRPVVHVELESQSPCRLTAAYENWRYRDRLLRKGESQSNSYKWAPPKGLLTSADHIQVKEEQILFYHQNPLAPTLFDVVVKQQGMEQVKEQLWNPLAGLTFGGVMQGKNLSFLDTVSGSYAGTDYKAWRLHSQAPARKHHLTVRLHTQHSRQPQEWEEGLQNAFPKQSLETARKQARAWWKSVAERSFIRIDEHRPGSEAWKIGRNYQLFRYMLACNAYGTAPTKFNGGLFSFDPVHVDSAQAFTPDYRKWGGGTFTAQNQRLVYFPMLKSGDFEWMKPQFDFYNRLLKNAEWRSRVYWGHEGACFTEQMENFGLPNPSEYGWKRPEWFDRGMEYNAWLEYEWDTVLEFCLMILECREYAEMEISEYVPLIESALEFFDAHYRYLATRRGRKALDEKGHLILYPGSGCETYKMAYNATSTIAALRGVLEKLLAYPLTAERRERWEKMLATLPPLNFRTIEGKGMIAPALHWERVNNIEVPQLYPVFPWRFYGVGRPGLDTARNTYWADPDAVRFRSHIGWKQDNIFAACLGLREEAKRLALLKFEDANLRFPAFWGPGYDWTPDHNWGGSAMIGLQEMLLQTAGDRILLFPAWPEEWDVHFRLFAPQQTVVEAKLENGKVAWLKVTPQEREKDVEIMLNRK